MTAREITDLARELLEAEGNITRMPGHFRHQLEQNPDALFLVELLRMAPRDAWDRMLAEARARGNCAHINPAARARSLGLKSAAHHVLLFWER
jgi:hypothetical protein